MDRLAIQRKIGNAITHRRKALGYSQEAFADSIEMHRAYFSCIERGEKNFELTTLLRVAEGLKASVFDLFQEARSASPVRVREKPAGRPARPRSTSRKNT